MSGGWTWTRVIGHDADKSGFPRENNSFSSAVSSNWKLDALVLPPQSLRLENANSISVTSFFRLFPSFETMIWSFSCLVDPLDQGILVQAACDVAALLPTDFVMTNSMEEAHVIRTAIADFLARRIVTDKIATLDDAVVPGRRRRKRLPAFSAAVPYVLERSDIWCSQMHGKLMVRVKESSDETAIQVVREALDDWTAAVNSGKSSLFVPISELLFFESILTCTIS